MKKFLLILGLFLFISTNLYAEYILEPANCTLKKKTNCGAYLYNNKTGATYFCDFEKCKEIMPALENSTSEVVKGDKKSKKSKIPKFKKKKKSKIPKFKKSE
jgi:hypothetical protein